MSLPSIDCPKCLYRRDMMMFMMMMRIKIMFMLSIQSHTTKTHVFIFSFDKNNEGRKEYVVNDVVK